MLKNGALWYKGGMANPIKRILLHLEPGLRMAIDPTEVYVLEAMGGVTELRGRGFDPLIDVEVEDGDLALGEVVGEIDFLALRDAHRVRRIVRRSIARSRSARRGRLGAGRDTLARLGLGGIAAVAAGNERQHQDRQDGEGTEPQ